MKYCIYQDRPLPMIASNKQVLTGCDIFGVHHNCETCPNLKEMPDVAYNAFNNDKLI